MAWVILLLLAGFAVLTSLDWHLVVGMSLLGAGLLLARAIR